MNDETFTSRFFKFTDPLTSSFMLPINDNWWSRKYEYPWAASFNEGNDISLDAACGIPHPFKFFLAENCRQTYACDLHENTGNFAATKQEMVMDFGEAEVNAFLNRYPAAFTRINFARASLTALPYPEKTFDKVYCLSVLEHLELLDITISLKQFHRVLKNHGKLIMTFDYPLIDVFQLDWLFRQTGFAYAGPNILEKPVDALFTDMFGQRLFCYRTVLQKNE